MLLIQEHYSTIYSLYPDGSNYVTQFVSNNTSSELGDGADGTLTPVPGATNEYYGTVYAGFTNDDGNSEPNDQGCVYILNPNAANQADIATVVYALDGDGNTPTDGQYTSSGRLQTDSSGDVYGETIYGGEYDHGTVFKVTPAGKETILHSFGSGTDGLYPNGDLTLASDGNYYGTAEEGGTDRDGVVFRISPTGANYAAVYNFGDGGSADGYYPESKPLEDSDGNLVGTTPQGGSGGDGVIYKLMTGLPNPVKLSSLMVSPSSVAGGSASATGTVTLAKPAPTAGAKVTLTSASTSVASVPASVTIPAGSETATFTITSHAVSQNSSVTITGSYNGTTASGSLTVTPPPAVALSSVNLSPASVHGGDTTTGNRAYLTGNASENTSVTITSSNPSVAKITTTPVTIKAGSSSHVFTIQTSAVTADKSVTITATANGVSKSATLTVTPQS